MPAKAPPIMTLASTGGRAARTPEKEKRMTYQVPDLAPGAEHSAEMVVKRSRFIVTMARVTSPEAAKAFVDRLKARHPDANHNCWAFNAGAPETTAMIGASDDGEPKGTAGRPMLTVLLHCGVGEVAAVVTRYFGGTLLGTGGLVRAYQDLVKLGLESLPVKERIPATQCLVTFEPRFLGKFQRLFEDAGAAVISRDFVGDVTYRLEVPDAAFARLAASVSEASAGRCELKKTDE